MGHDTQDENSYAGQVFEKARHEQEVRRGNRPPDLDAPSGVWSFGDQRFVAESEYHKAFARGVRIGREEAHAETVSAEVGPSDYEVWRDALLMATEWVSMHGRDPDKEEIPGFAEWFWNLLNEVPMLKGEPSYEPADGDRHDYEQGDDGCTHCDADALDLIHEVGEYRCPDCGTKAERV